MEWQVRRLNQELKKHDSELFARRESSGVIVVYRIHRRYEAYDLDEGKLLVLRYDPLYCFALTDNWTIQGKPVDWGLEPVMNHLREIDAWNRDLEEAYERDWEKKEESKKRAQRSELEAIAGEVRRPFAKATSDIRTALFDKNTRSQKWH